MIQVKKYEFNRAVPSLGFGRFHTILRLEERGMLPLYKGSMLRGSFGSALKKVSCVNPGRDCKACPACDSCAYSYIFETPIPADALRMKKYPNAPHPFVITPIDRGKMEFEKNDRLAYQISLFGRRALSYLPYVINALEMAGENGCGSARLPAVVEKVQQILIDGRLITVFEEGKGMTAAPITEIFEDTDSGGESEEVTLQFVTPLRLQKDGRILGNFDFRTLCSALLRRFTNMAYFHAGFEVDMDFRAFLEEAAKVKIVKNNLHRFQWGRYSNRQEQSMDMDGMTGTITFSGLNNGHFTLLKVGEILHAGKNTSFGMGGYIMNSEAKK